MKELIVHKEKPRDVAITSRGTDRDELNTFEGNTVQHLQLKHTPTKVCVNGILPMVVMFEQPTKYSIESIIEILNGTDS